MLRLWLAALALWAFAAPASAQFNSFPPGVFNGRQVYDPAPSGGGCSQATTANARLDGSQNIAAVTTLICGLVTDGNYAGLDALYLIAINSIGNAEVNLATSTSYNITVGVAGTFTANSGLAGNGTTTFYSTNFTPSTATSPNFTQNAASVGVCLLNSSTATGTAAVLGTVGTNGNDYVYLVPNSAASTAIFDMNDVTFPTATQSSSNLQGSWVISRTTSTLMTLYENGSSIGTSAATTNPVSNAPIYLFAYNNSGGAAQFSNATIGWMFIGGALTGTQVSQITSRLKTYSQTVNGANAC
jgi:hypothetical protein